MKPKVEINENLFGDINREYVEYFNSNPSYFHRVFETNLQGFSVKIHKDRKGLIKDVVVDLINQKDIQNA